MASTPDAMLAPSVAPVEAALQRQVDRLPKGHAAHQFV
jgi:hypothetical protein